MRKYQETVSSATTGLPILKAQVTVFQADGTTPVTVYSDAGITPVTGPVLTDGFGSFYFFVLDGTYTLKIADPNGVLLQTLTKVEIYEDARNVSVPVGEPAVALPSIGTRAGKLLAFDGGGVPVPSVSAAVLLQASTDAINAAATAAVDAAADVAAALEADVQSLVDEAQLFAQQASAASGSGGYFSHPRTKKRFKYVALDGAAVMAAAPQIFLDPENGNDAWDGNYGYRIGTTTSGPKRTRAGVEAHPAFIANDTTQVGVTIAIIASDTPWRDGFDYYDPNSRNGNNRRKYVNLCVYGGSMRTISCLDVINKASISAHPTITNAYRVSVTHDMHTGGVSQFRIFVDGQPSLLRKATEAECSAAGTYWYSGTPVAGGTTVITFHPYANNDPRSDSSVYEVTMRDYAFGGGDGCSVEGIHAVANGSNNGGISLYNYGEVRRCVAEEGTKHNWLMGPGGEAFDVISVNSQDSRNYSSDAMGNQFVMFDAAGAGLHAQFTRCAGLLDASVYTYSGADAGGPAASWFYSHGTNGIEGVTLRDCWQANIQGLAGGEHSNTTLIDHAYFYYGTPSGPSGMWSQNTNGSLTIRRALAVGSFTRLFAIDFGGDVDAEGVVAISSHGGTAFFYGGGGDSRLRLKNCIMHDTGVSVGPINWTLSATTTIEMTYNIISNFYFGQAFGTNVSPASAVIDHNYYTFYNGGGAVFGQWKGTDYSTFSAWKTATGFDTNTTVVTGTPPANTAWLSGSAPDPVTADVRINPASPAYLELTALPDQAWINSKLTLPQTRDAAVAYVKNTAPATPVLVAP